MTHDGIAAIRALRHCSGMADRPRVLISDDLAPACTAVLEQHGCAADYRAGIDLGTLAEACQGAAGLLVRSRTKVTAELLAAAPTLRAIGRAGAGVDNIDVPAASARKVCVMNTPGGNTRSVAEHAIGLILALLRHIPRGDASMRSGGFDKKGGMGHEVQGKTLCIVGPGKIGRETAGIARALGMTVIGAHHAPSPEKAKAVGMELRRLPEALAAADVVSLHVPGGSGTKHLIDAKALATMQKGSWLVNCARGTAVDQRALIAALDSGHLAGAALDVFPEEPPPTNDPIRTHPKVICTPHLGASTLEAQDRVALAVAKQVADYLVRGTVVDAVNANALR